MIALPLKQAQPIDWVAPLRFYLTNVYGSSNEFASEITTFNSMRESVSDPPLTTSGRDLLYRYFGQLDLLDMRIPLSDRGCRIKFEWRNLFDGETVVQSSAAFEKACVLFNLAAVQSHIGATNDHKTSYAAYQAAAGIFKFISESFLHAPTIDCASETAQTLSVLMLAQAQHAFLNRAIEGQTKPGLLSKLSKSAADRYAEAGTRLEALYNDESWGESEWYEHCNVQAQTMLGNANLYMSLHLDSTKKFGAAIAHMKEAKTIFKELPESDQSYELACEKLKTMERDNDLIYHEVVSAVFEDLPATDAAKPTPLEKLYIDQNVASKVVGRDLFSRVIPLDVHERASMYSEEKAQMLRNEQEKVDVADEELKSALEFMDLPRSASMLRHPDQSAEDISGVPGLVKEWSQEVSSAGPLVFDLAARRQRILDRVQTGVETHSAQRIKQSLIAAVATDNELEASHNRCKADVDILRQGFGAGSPLSQSFVFSATSAISLLDLDDSERATVNESLENVLNDVVKLQKIHNERRKVFAEFKEKVHADDISDKLVAHRKTAHIEEALFKPELAKFSPYIQRVDSTVRHQTILLNELSNLWKQTLASPIVRKQASDRESVLSQRAVAIERYRQAYETWLAIKEGLNRAHKFYDDLEGSIVPDMGSLSISATNTGQAPVLPPKPSDFSGYTMPSAYDSSLYQR